MIRPEGAAQIALIGPPNAGKSSLHARLTGSGARVAPYPFTTQYPHAGMMPYEDVHFQLIDLPAIAREHPVPWLVSTLQTADATLLVVDLGELSCLEQLQAVESVLQKKRVTLTEHLEATGESEGSAASLATFRRKNDVSRGACAGELSTIAAAVGAAACQGELWSKEAVSARAERPWRGRC